MNSKKSKVIRILLVLVLFAANLFTYTLEIGRYKYIDDIYYIKQELDGTQTLCEINLENYKEDDILIIPGFSKKISATILIRNIRR